MTLPVTVEIAFGVDPFDSTTLNTGSNWTDVTGSVRSLDYQTSTRSDRFGVFSAGSAMVALDDLDREFDPSNSGSTYVGEFKRDVPVRIIGTHSSTDYVQWYGYVTLWTPGYQGKDAVTTVQAHDGLGLLARYDLDQLASPAYSCDTAGGRIARVLDLLGFPSGYRDLDNGTGLTSTSFGVNALQHCQLVAASDGGLFYADRDGTLTFDGLSALTTTRQVTSQATLTDYLNDPGPTRTGVGAGFRNLVRIGGEAVTTAEQDNVGANQVPVAYQRLYLLMNADAQATALAGFYADLYGAETPFTKTATYTVATSAGATSNSALFPRRLRDRVTLNLTPPGGGTGISDQVFIGGVRGRIGQNQRWDIEHTYSSADAYDDNLAAPPSQWLILDDATNGVLDTDRLAY